MAAIKCHLKGKPKKIVNRKYLSLIAIIRLMSNLKETVAISRKNSEYLVQFCWLCFWMLAWFEKKNIYITKLFLGKWYPPGQTKCSIRNVASNFSFITVSNHILRNFLKSFLFKQCLLRFPKLEIIFQRGRIYNCPDTCWWHYHPLTYSKSHRICTLLCL